VTFATDDVLRIGELTFFGGAGNDGFFIDAEGFEGWEDAPDVRFEEVERPNSHGSFDALSFYGARMLTVSGLCLAKSAEELGSYGNKLRSALTGQIRTLVDYQGVTSYSDGRLASQVKFRTEVPGRIARYQFSLRFPNPRRFGAFQQFASAADGRWTAHHRGNFGASPVIDITGNCPSYTIGGPDSTEYKVNAPVSPAQPHQIDLGTGLLSIAGGVVFGKAIRADTWVIASGQQVPHRITPDGNGDNFVDAVMTVRDTYI